MTAFWQGVKFGFVNGMLNNMFGGFGFWGGCSPCCQNPWQFNATSLFFTPTFQGNFYQYPTYTPTAPSIDMSSWSIFSSQMQSSFNPGWGDCYSFTTTKSTSNKTETTPSKPISYDAEKLMETWTKVCQKEHISDRISQEFCNKVVQVAQKVKCDPNDLMALMYGESRFNHTIVNGIGAVGLIQFTKNTRKSMGVTKEQLQSMSRVQQMDYVEKFLLKWKKRMYSDDHVLTAGELGALTFLPAYSKRDVLTRKGEEYYEWNPGLDWNKDNKITKEDLENRLHSFYA